MTPTTDILRTSIDYVMPLEAAVQTMRSLALVVANESKGSAFDRELTEAVSYILHYPNEHVGWAAFAGHCIVASERSEYQSIACFADVTTIEVTWRTEDREHDRRITVRWTYEFGNAEGSIRVDWDTVLLSQRDVAEDADMSLERYGRAGMSVTNCGFDEEGRCYGCRSTNCAGCGQ